MGRSKIRWLVGIGIVGFWLAMMAGLARRELGVQRLEAGPATRIEKPTDTWMGIYVRGRPTGEDEQDQTPGEEQRVGHVHVGQIPEERRGLAGARMTLDAAMKLQLLGKATNLELSGFVWRPYDRAEAEFEFAVRSAQHEFRIAGQIAGGKLSGEAISAGESFPFELPVKGDMLFSSGFVTTFELPRLEVGEEYRLESFDPLTLQKSPARVRCVAHETLDLGDGPIAVRRLQVTVNGIRSQAWIDDAGEVVRAETPFGLILQRIPGPEAAATPDLAEEPSAVEAGKREPGEGLGDLLGQTAIRPTGQRPFRSARIMTVQLQGLDGRRLPGDEVQADLGDGRYRLTVPAAPEDDATISPPEGSLAADVFVQSDHPEIRRQAAVIVGSESDPWRRALLLHEWVYTRLDKEAVVSIPSALEVLQNRRGDCNEHTVLYTALARATGLPTRIAIGVVWSDELEGFYYHAWPEVHLDGRWVWMDPTLDQPLADATHLKLLNGGIESWPQLLAFIGRLQIEVLEVE